MVVYPETNFGGFACSGRCCQLFTVESSLTVFAAYFPPNRRHSVRFSLQIDSKITIQVYILYYILYCTLTPAAILYTTTHIASVRACVVKYVVEPWKRCEWQRRRHSHLVFYLGNWPFTHHRLFFTIIIIIRPLNALCLCVCVFSAAIGFRTQKEQTNRLICGVGCIIDIYYICIGTVR